MTRSSEALQAAQREGKVVYHTVRCGLKKAVRSPALGDVFADFAVRVGVARHVVSLVANELVIRASRSGGLEIADWFHWYTKVWSAVDFAANPSGLSSKNEMIDGVKQVIDSHPEMLANFRAAVPQRCPVMVRQQECNGLATATVEHIGMFPRRLLSYLTVRITGMLCEVGVAPDGASDAARDARTFVLANPSSENSEAALRGALATKGLPLCAVEQMVALCVCERKTLGDLVTSKHTLDRWCVVAKSKKRASRMLPHLLRYSEHMSSVLREEISGHMEDEGVRRKWSRDRKPRPFSALPIAALQPSMVYYGFTEVDALYGHIHDEELREFKARQARRKPKRKRDDEDDEDDDKNDPAATPVRFHPDRVHFAKTIFVDRLPIKGVKEHWSLVNFRTDGVCLTLTFAVPNGVATHGVAELVNRGYLSVPTCESVDVAAEGRGLWHITQTNGSLECSHPDINVVAVDPGFVKPVQWCSVRSDAPLDDTISQDAAFDSINEATWMRLSGRTERASWEQRRRLNNPEYAAAIEAFSGVFRKTADARVFSDYVGLCGRTLLVRSAELCHRRRSLRRWLAKRRSQSFLSRVADRIAKRESCRLDSSSPCVSLMTDEEKAEHRERSKRDHGDTRRTVVFFGDGQYHHTRRHHASVPKKSVLHELGTRTATVLIDEFRTSKHCVCGCLLATSADDKAGSRVRVHQDGGDCFTLQCGICDRDELATLNIALASLTCLRKLPWPTHLKRTTAADEFEH